MRAVVAALVAIVHRGIMRSEAVDVLIVMVVLLLLVAVALLWVGR